MRARSGSFAISQNDSRTIAGFFQFVRLHFDSRPFLIEMHLLLITVGCR
ncbi:hypothetical protein SBBP1_720017 [Burkholderiales bacterium]|nr:hypothetical protein SBBP1_720017 [Burkholderiales bacterium]